MNTLNVSVTPLDASHLLDTTRSTVHLACSIKSPNNNTLSSTMTVAQQRADALSWMSDRGLKHTLEQSWESLHIPPAERTRFLRKIAGAKAPRNLLKFEVSALLLHKESTTKVIRAIQCREHAVEELELFAKKFNMTPHRYRASTVADKLDSAFCEIRKRTVDVIDRLYEWKGSLAAVTPFYYENKNYLVDVVLHDVQEIVEVKYPCLKEYVYFTVGETNPLLFTNRQDDPDERRGATTTSSAHYVNLCKLARLASPVPGGDEYFRSTCLSIAKHRRNNTNTLTPPTPALIQCENRLKEMLRDEAKFPLTKEAWTTRTRTLVNSKARYYWEFVFGFVMLSRLLRIQIRRIRCRRAAMRIQCWFRKIKARSILNVLRRRTHKATCVQRFCRSNISYQLRLFRALRVKCAVKISRQLKVYITRNKFFIILRRLRAQLKLALAWRRYQFTAKVKRRVIQRRASTLIQSVFRGRKQRKAFQFLIRQDRSLKVVQRCLMYNTARKHVLRRAMEIIIATKTTRLLRWRASQVLTEGKRFVFECAKKIQRECYAYASRQLRNVLSVKYEGACCIQRAFRSHKARCLVSTQLASREPNTRVAMHIDLHKCRDMYTRVLQRWWCHQRCVLAVKREHIRRKAVFLQQEKLHAAMAIQRAVRCMIARRALLLRKCIRRNQYVYFWFIRYKWMIESQAAHLIQRMWRAHVRVNAKRNAVVRGDIALQHETAALRIQACWRRHSARTKCEKTLLRTALRQDEEAKLLARNENATMLLVFNFRAYVFRRQIHQLVQVRKHKMACKIQAWWRGISSRKSTLQKQVDETRRLYISVLRIQAFFRCYREVKNDIRHRHDFEMMSFL